jgi:VanZ family protein
MANPRPNSTNSALDNDASRSENVQFVRALVTWGPLALVCSAIFWQSNQPAFGQPDMLSSLGGALFGRFAWYARVEPTVMRLDWAGSYLGHFVEYTLFGLAAFWAVHRQWPKYAHPYALAFSFATFYALSDEFHQFFVPGRHCDWKDVATDMVGALFALTVVRVWRGRS